MADSFGVNNGSGSIEHPNRALVVNQCITSSRFLDVFYSIPVKQESWYAKTMRLVILADDYNTGKRENGRPKSEDSLHLKPKLMSDYIQLIYASIWGYVLNIPFAKEPNLPSPIKFADHYASWQYSTLTARDKNVKNLSIDIKNAKPKIS